MRARVPAIPRVGLAVTAWATALLLGLLLLPAPARGETKVEPIAKVVLEGGWDSNVFYDGNSADRTSRVSPDVGLRVRDHLYDVSATYGGDWVVYRDLAPDGFWNQRGTFAVEATPSRRLELRGTARVAYAYDPVGLAMNGVFREGRQAALMINAGGRLDGEVTSRLVLGVALIERGAQFDDHTGGMMHAPSLDVLWRLDPRLSVGGAFAFQVFQDFHPEGDQVAFANALRARLRYRVTRVVEVDAFAGPALWRGPDEVAIVPEAGVEVRVTSLWFDLRTTVAHRLGIGSTASPGLVDSAEVGAVRRVGRRWELRGDAGIWRSGEPPTGANANVGWAFSGEAGLHVGAGARVALAAAHFARLDDTSTALRRTVVGLRLGWELPVR
ncbi:MAG: hypothetical protein QM767_00520 [Anaeromyxobacter sp.]